MFYLYGDLFIERFWFFGVFLLFQILDIQSLR